MLKFSAITCSAKLSCCSSSSLNSAWQWPGVRDPRRTASSTLDEAFTRFSYVLRFEMFPSEGKTRQEKIFNQLLRVFPDFKEAFLDYAEKRPTAASDFLNVKIKGKNRYHKFDVYVGKNALRISKSKLHSYIKYYGPIFVRCFEKKEPINERDLSQLRDEICDCLEPLKRTVSRIVVVSTSSFAESAVNYAKDKRSRIGQKTFDLIEETPKGYRVIWISS